jgi:hypothetical protein
MDRDKIFRIFSKFIGQKYINIKGIFFEPIDVSYGGREIVFKMYNPNDISYFDLVLKEELESILYDFKQYTEISLDSTIFDCEKLYINKELTEKIKNFFASIHQIDAYDKYLKQTIVIYGKSIGFNFETDEDRLIFWNEFVPNRGFIVKSQDDTVVTDNLVETIENYYDFLEQDSSYWESENIYIKMDVILSDYPLISPEWMATYYHTGFLNYV